MTPRTPVRLHNLEVTYTITPNGLGSVDHHIVVKSSSSNWSHTVFIDDARKFGVTLAADGRIVAITYIADGKGAFVGKTYQSIQLFDRQMGISLNYVNREVGKEGCTK